MNILILGGTIFLGRHLVEAALARNHTVTLFNRGQHNPDLFPHVERLYGDRNGNLEALAGRRWDAVIDTSGYVPRLVTDTARLLSESVDLYIFISSISVYKSFSIPEQDETAPVSTLDDETVETISGETYGALKALCEQAAERAMPYRVLNIRPGLIVGPNDPTDRFTYWTYRIAQGGEVLLPDRPDLPVQFIDVRDLADWTILMVENRATGTFNATGPDYSLTIDRLFHTCKQVSSSDATGTYVAPGFLLDHQVQPWIELPLWVPGEDALSQISIQKARSAGLQFRPLEETVAATLEWLITRPADYSWRAGLTPDKEQAVLSAWHAHLAAERQPEQEQSSTVHLEG